MNAADRRRLTPALGVLCVLLAVLMIVLRAGLGRAAHWDDTAQPARLPALKAATPPPSVPPLQEFADVWEHPLFSPDRKPIPGSGDSGRSADSSNLELTGVIIQPDMKMALLREHASGRTLRLREGQTADGATVIEVKPRSAVVEAGGSRSELALKPGAAPAADAEDNAPAGAASTDAASAQEATVSQMQPEAAPPVPMQQPVGDAARQRLLRMRIEQRRREAAARAQLQQQQQQQQQRNPQQNPSQRE